MVTKICYETASFPTKLTPYQNFKHVSNKTSWENFENANDKLSKVRALLDLSGIIVKYSLSSVI